MKRLMVVAENSSVGSGYGVLAHSFLTRLHARGDLSVCEYSTYSSPEDTPNHPWQVLHNRPRRDDPAYRDFISNGANELGGYGFERALLSFKPDVVWTYRDAWYDTFVEDSPLRSFYRHCAMPAVDAERQHPDWLGQLSRADAVLTYTEWAANLLRDESGGLVDPVGWAPPGADYDIFRRREDRDQLRAMVGMGPEHRIVGTCMRSQVRKLFPDLLEAFGRILKSGPEEVRTTSWLYLHTGYPDESWHLPELATEFGVSHRILMTYVCPCGQAFPARFQDAVTRCRCGQCARPAGTGNGVPRDTLALIMNLWDVYVQVAVGEGLGMPQIEAAACEVPVVAVDFSAMGDVVKKVGGTPIKVARTYLEPQREMGRRMALPCLNDLTAKLTMALLQPEPLRRRAGLIARAGAMANYNYDKSAELLAQVVLSMPPAQPWNAPYRPLPPEPPVPDKADPSWCIERVGGRPDLRTSSHAARMARQLFWGHLPTGQPYSLQQVVDECRALRNVREYWERARCEAIGGRS